MVVWLGLLLVRLAGGLVLVMFVRDYTAADGASHCVTAGVMAYDAASDRATQASLGRNLCRNGRCQTCCANHHGNDYFHR